MAIRQVLMTAGQKEMTLMTCAMGYMMAKETTAPMAMLITGITSKFGVPRMVASTILKGGCKRGKKVRGCTGEGGGVTC